MNFLKDSREKIVFVPLERELPSFRMLLSWIQFLQSKINICVLVFHLDYIDSFDLNGQYNLNKKRNRFVHIFYNDVVYLTD